MESEKFSSFNDKPVKISRMVLSDCNPLIVPVANSIGRFSMGESDLFLHWKPTDFMKLQELMCKYISWCDTGKNITLFDISENFVDFIGLKFEFLEFNYGFFSQSRKIEKRIYGRASEIKETPSSQPNGNVTSEKSDSSSQKGDLTHTEI